MIPRCYSQVCEVCTDIGEICNVSDFSLFLVLVPVDLGSKAKKCSLSHLY